MRADILRNRGIKRRYVGKAKPGLAARKDPQAVSTDYTDWAAKQADDRAAEQESSLFHSNGRSESIPARRRQFITRFRIGGRRIVVERPEQTVAGIADFMTLSPLDKQ
jgi:hypothetical protein